MNTSHYLNEIKARLATSSIVATIDIVTEELGEDKGYFRARMNLTNGDFLEVSEYFVLQNNQPITLEYRYQWMDGKQQKLIKRWDNAEHYPDLKNFPHHIHVDLDSQVIPGYPLSIIDLLMLIEELIGIEET
ncbi:MAG: hypothetical protein MAG431_00356 [Chloroflexi bacterium]|nr:hypothetical protein [Chloroflexota bacterium]